jgi:hypothetical protein
MVALRCRYIVKLAFLLALTCPEPALAFEDYVACGVKPYLFAMW